jgi:hypothetical protein
MLPLEPPLALWIGTTFAIFICDGTTEFSKDKLIICCTVVALLFGKKTGKGISYCIGGSTGFGSTQVEYYRLSQMQR